MKWEKLLSDERFQDKKQGTTTDARTRFQRDVDRVIFTSAFRRLQNKTQVFPIPKSDFIHNRLTHSLEVSRVGRSLGTLAGKFVISQEQKLEDKGYTPNDFGNIIAAACLAHDIGNPPFGHSGESAISSFFASDRGRHYLEALDGQSEAAQKKNDFLNFEGNAAGFRILTNTHPAKRKGGLRLTYATLGAFTKYPWESMWWHMKNGKGDQPPQPHHESKCKYGFFFEENNLFAEVANQLGLPEKGEGKYQVWARHPLSFLLEAADTICYLTIDLEDGHKLGHVKYDDIKELFLPIIKASKETDFSETVLQQIADKSEKVGYLRSALINALIFEVIDVFKAQYDEIMEGNFTGELTDNIEHDDLFNNDIKQLNVEKVYKADPVVEIELAGYEILGGLLDIFLSSAFNQDHPKSEKINDFIPFQFKAQNKTGWDDDPYMRMLKIVDFVSRMTDEYAISTYRKLKGINLPVIN